MPPLVIAHRGASAYEPENTLRAFDLAIRQDAQMIELDLHITLDHQVVVIHDPTLDHTTNLRGRVDQMMLDEIKRADAGKGERVPTLDETLDLTMGKVRLYLEIKDPYAAEETLLAINDAIDRLAKDEPEAAAVVKLRYFAGFTIEETAAAMNISVRTVNRHWTYAKSWLYQELA